MKPKKIIYYQDEIHDDFAATRDALSGYSTPSDFDYLPQSAVQKILSSVVYRGVTPLASLWCRFAHGVYIQNRKAVFSVPGGFFLYGNHTQNVCDAFIPTLISFPRRCRIVTGPDAVSLPILQYLVPMLGGMPLPGNPACARRFLAAIRKCIAENETVTIYPEAHIWPYYNKIRPFPADSFTYPARMKVPVIAFTVTYRERLFLRDHRPRITVTLSDPIMPGTYQNHTELRDRVYNFMCRTVEQQNSVAYYEYRKE